MNKDPRIRMAMYESLQYKYKSQMAEAEATLLIYFTSPVGIGEHPQHVEEMDKLIEKISNADDKLKTLETFMKYESL
jgi:hypothetical protein